MNDQLRAVRLEINNVLGIDEITIDLSGNITEISGANGQGKTSCIEALRSVLTSVDSGTLLRNGAANGKAVLIFDDGSQIISAFKPGQSSKRVMFDGSGRAMPKSSSEIAKLFDANSFNPAAFLATKGKARVDLLLQAMPFEMDINELNALCGPRHEVHHIDGKDDIYLIGVTRDALYDLRTGDNRVANDTKATIRTLQQSLASVQPFDAARLSECSSIAAKIDTELGEQITKAKQAYVAKKSVCDDAINSAAETKLALKHAYEMECRELDSAIKASQLGITNSLSSTKQQIKVFQGQSALRSSSVKTEIELLEAAKKAFEGQEVTRKSIVDMEVKVKINEDRSAELTKSIKNIDDYKAELLADMPIKGLSIDGDKLMLDGVIFDRVNTAKRVGVAMKLAELRAGKLKLIVFDGLDMMDDETREEFYKAGNASPCRFVVTRVTNKKLTVTQPMAGQGQKTSDMEAETPDMKAW